MNAVRSRPYQRRRRGPVIVVVAALAVIATATWATVFVNNSGPAGLASCPSPSTGASPGEVLSSDALDTVAPAPPGSVQVRVLNAGGQRGQANLVAAQLGDLGFAEAAPPNNDPLFPNGDMACVGQLRFGAAGEAAASTVSLVIPCAELVRDGRKDATVDVAVGTAFGDLKPIRAVRDTLNQLSEPATGSDGAANADPGASDAAAPNPAAAVDPSTLQKARERHC
jgi:LytR cell envelope-related transcriptional attenuator